MGKSEANTFPCRAERSYRLRIGADFVTSPAREDFRSSFSKGSVGASVGESRWSSVFCRGSCQLPDGEADHCRGSRACRAVAAAEAGRLQNRSQATGLPPQFSGFQRWKLLCVWRSAGVRPCRIAVFSNGQASSPPAESGSPQDESVRLADRDA